MTCLEPYSEESLGLQHHPGVSTQLQCGLCSMLPLVVAQGSALSLKIQSYLINYPTETPAFGSLPSAWSPLLTGHLCPFFPSAIYAIALGSESPPFSSVPPPCLYAFSEQRCRDHRTYLSMGQEKASVVPPFTVYTAVLGPEIKLPGGSHGWFVL